MVQKTINQGVKIGLALCGGGARGIAHAGILKALEESDIFPDYFSGSSMGAIVGAFYAEGLKPEAIVEILSKPRVYKALSLGFPDDGLTDLNYLKNLLKKNIAEDTFEALTKPLFVCVTNLNTGAYEIISSGKLSIVVIASSAIPIVFKPVKIDNYQYVDGGLLNNLPVEPLLDKCQIIIGTNVNPYDLDEQVDGMFEIAERSINLVLRQNSLERIKQCDIFIDVKNAYGYGIFDFKDAPTIYQAGYEQTLKQIPEIKAKILEKQNKKTGLSKFWHW